MKATTTLFVLAMLAPAACVDAPDNVASTEFDDSAGTVDVIVLGDGFVRVGERRLPLEALVLELRQAARRMSASELSRFVVQLRITDAIHDGAEALTAERGLGRLIDELDVMEIAQVRLTTRPTGLTGGGR